MDNMKLIYPLAVILVSFGIAEVQSEKGCDEPYFCETCGHGFLCPRSLNEDIAFICPEHLTCYLMGKLACEADGCSEAGNARPTFECPGPGVFADRMDCTKSFSCIELFNGSYKVVADSCPPGMHFSDRDKKCTAPERTTCHRELLHLHRDMSVANDDEFQCHEVGVFPEPDSGEYFYICEMDEFALKKLRFKCPEGMEFHPHESRCI